MKKILHVSCSPRGRAAESYRLSQEIIDFLLQKEPTAVLVNRVIGGGAISHVDENYAISQQSSADISQEGSIARSEELIQEIESSDFVVIGTPMHNFTVPSALKGVDRSRRSSSSDVQCDQGRKSRQAARSSSICRRILGRTIFRRARASARFSDPVSESSPRHRRTARSHVFLRSRNRLRSGCRS
jgi:Flavodoxin-like fold